MQLVCIHLVLFVIPCSTLDTVWRTCVSLSVVGNAHTLRGVAVSRGSRWSPHPCVTLATRRTPSASGARWTRGSCSWFSWWSCRRESDVVSGNIPDTRRQPDVDFMCWWVQVGVPQSRRAVIVFFIFFWTIAPWINLSKKWRRNAGAVSYPHSTQLT